MGEPRIRLVFDTSALLDLFGKWTDDHKQRRGDLVAEVALLGPLKPYLWSTRDIREEIREHMIIGTELDRYITFDRVDDAELQAVPGFLSTREADFSLTALCLRLEKQAFRVFLITKDRTFTNDLRKASSKAVLVPPTGFAEAITVLTPSTSRSVALAHNLQNNTFVNLSRAMRLVRQTQGEASYHDWQNFLNSHTLEKHDLIEALRATGIRLG